MLVGGSTQTFGRLVLEQLNRVGELRKLQWDYLSQWIVGLNAGPWRSCFEPIWAKDFDPEKSCQGIKMKSWDAYEALCETTGDVMRKLNMPLFAIQGSADINIDPREISRMQKLMKGRDAEFHLVYGLDHSLVNHFDQTTPTALDSEALQRMEGFLRSVPSY